VTTALYRRYRPQTYADVIGQEHVTEPLMQALRSGRVGHAYLFSGPRGCGKTTSARILARCLNCEQGPTPTPCGECPSCVALATGGPGSVDVIEIDAASHGGVDDARDLREKAAYGPAQSRFKVYIIDEAHMVTPQGFNALLKIVEEPPEHVKFVFATTEPEKVIGTIRSRTHHYPFRLVPPTRLSEYLESLCAREGVAVEPGVLSFVVRAGGGSVRDSLSVLDQLIAGSGPEGLTYAGAAALLGFTEAELLDAVVDALAAGDGGAVFRQLDKVIETGHDPRRFVEDLLERFRDLIIVSASEDAAAAVLRGVPEDQLTRMRQQAASFGPGELSRSADIVNAGLTELSGATAPRLQLELICARLLLPAAAGPGGYAARLDRLERRLEMAGPTPPDGTSRPALHPDSTPVEDSAFASGSAGAPAGGREALRQAHAASRGGASDPVDSPPAARAEAAPAGAESPLAEPSPQRVAEPTRQRGAERSPQRPEAEQSPQRGAESSPQRGAEASPQRGAAPPRGGLDTDAVRRSWPDVLAKVFGIRRVTWTFLSEHAQVLEYDGRRLVLGIATEGLARTFHHGPHGEVVRQALIETLGVDVAVEGRVMPARGSEPPTSSPTPPPPPPAQSALSPTPSMSPTRSTSPGAGTATRSAGAAPGVPASAQRPTPLDALDDDEAEELLDDDDTELASPTGVVDETASAAGLDDDDDDDDGDGDGDDDAGPTTDVSHVGEANDGKDPEPQTGPPGVPADPAWPADDDPGDGAGYGPQYAADPHPDEEPDDEWAPVPGPKGDPLDVFAGAAPAAPSEPAAASEPVRASEPAAPAEPPAPAPPAPPPPAAPRPAGGRARMSAYERAKASLGERDPGVAGASSGSRGDRGRSGRAVPATQEAEDAEVSVDDENIQDSGAIGQPVIAKVLGGVVIDERQE
jgi:DNA polymerase-3 subunit gamma/tau